MLSPAVIQRNFQHLDYDKMLKDLSENGMALSLPLRLRLAQPETAPAAATALGLRRLLELTYSPTPTSQDMTDRLLALQHPDGSFGPDPLATAAAVAALGRVLQEQGNRLTPQRKHQLTDARMQGFSALLDTQSSEGAFICKDPWADVALGTAFVLFLLADDHVFREAIRYADLMTWMEQRAERLDAPTYDLWQMACLDDAPAWIPVAA